MGGFPIGGFQGGKGIGKRLKLRVFTNGTGIISNPDLRFRVSVFIRTDQLNLTRRTNPMNTADNQQYTAKIVVLLLWISLVISICVEKMPENQHKFIPACRRCSTARTE